MFCKKSKIHDTKQNIHCIILYGNIVNILSQTRHNTIIANAKFSPVYSVLLKSGLFVGFRQLEHPRSTKYSVQYSLLCV